MVTGQVVFFVCLLPGIVNAVTLHENQDTYTAGDTIELIYCLERDFNGDCQLIVQYSLGSFLLQENTLTDHVIFRIPSQISSIAGLVSVRLFHEDQLIHDHEFQVTACPVGNRVLESYCGPKHLVTDRNDFTMITSSILDQYDNPVPAGTAIVFSRQHFGQIENINKNTSELYAFTRFHAPNKRGYAMVTARHQNLGEEGFRLTYYAHDPGNFNLTYKRQHSYADGEQLVEISTSKLVDRWGNSVGNGTVVRFRIKHKDGSFTALQGTSINGVAKVSIRAPYHADRWEVTATIENFAATSTISRINFLPAVTTIPTDLDNNILTIGPITGHLGQFVRDQTPVEISSAGHVFTTYLVGGWAQVNLDQLGIHRFSKDTGIRHFHIKISLCGITKIIDLP